VDLQKEKERLFDYLETQIVDKRVVEAMLRVPRELFIPDELVSHAYEDRPISIGYGQTISQPYIVALMTQALDISKNDKVLELGTGRGYQTAILAELAKTVISVERIPQLVTKAENILKKLGYNNIHIHLSTGKLGWKQDSPYNAIIVTAAAPRIPEALVEQLAAGGRMIIPVGNRWEQELILLKKGEDKNIINNLGFCRFVPLIGEDAWDE
jgi:protein-L-isoaspartate(D-aspartate) O-methyltransferase